MASEENGHTTLDLEHKWDKGRQWDWPLQRDDGLVHMVNTQQMFEVSFQVKDFTPTEISVCFFMICVGF